MPSTGRRWQLRHSPYLSSSRKIRTRKSKARSSPLSHKTLIVLTLLSPPFFSLILLTFSTPALNPEMMSLFLCSHALASWFLFLSVLKLNVFDRALH